MTDREAFEAFAIANTGVGKLFSPPAPISSEFYFRFWQAVLAHTRSAEPPTFDDWWAARPKGVDQYLQPAEPQRAEPVAWGIMYMGEIHDAFKYKKLAEHELKCRNTAWPDTTVYRKLVPLYAAPPPDPAPLDDEAITLLREFPGRSCGESEWNDWLFSRDAYLAKVKL